MGRPVSRCLRSQPADDLSSAGGNIAECPSSDQPLEFLHYRFGKATRIGRKGLLENQPHHFPVARSRVFAGRGQVPPCRSCPPPTELAGIWERGRMFPKPSRASSGSFSGREAATCPSVSLPVSPKKAASGISPIPTPSSTKRRIRENPALVKGRSAREVEQRWEESSWRFYGA